MNTQTENLPIEATAPELDTRDQAAEATTEATPRRRAPAPRGMTLVEIMVVIAIIGTITVVLANGVIGSSKEADISAANILINKVSEQIDSHRARSTPRAYPESLQVLVEKEMIDEGQTKDPWGTPLSYSTNGRTYELCSGGPDQTIGGGDDICKSSTNRK
ncbi:MAG: type II secretion system protein GspG [Myxococcota bacterium]